MASSSQNRKNYLTKVKIENVDVVILSSDDDDDQMVHRRNGMANSVVRGRNGMVQGNGVVQGRNGAVQGRNDAVHGNGVGRGRNGAVEGRNDVCEWITSVTRAIQKLKRKQTLHVPAWVVKDCLQFRNQIKLQSIETKRTYNCSILNPNRTKFERYIGDGWYDFLGDHKPKVGDLLHFAVKSSPTLMTVNLIRKDRTR